MSDLIKAIEGERESLISKIASLENERDATIAEIHARYQSRLNEAIEDLRQVETAIMVARRIASRTEEEQGEAGEDETEGSSGVSGRKLGVIQSVDTFAGGGINGKRRPGRKKSLKGKSAVEATQAVLEDAGAEFLEPLEVARRAISRGYLGRIYGDDPEKNAASFFDVLRRRPHLYVRDEHDRFRLRRADDPPYIGPDNPRSHEGSRAWMAEEVLRASDRPMTATEIAEGIIAAGMVVGQGLRAVRNSIVTAMDRDCRFVRLEQGLYKLASFRIE